MEKKFNPLELFVLVLTCWTTTCLAWLKKMDRVIGTALYSWERRISSFMKAPETAEVFDWLAVVLGTLALLSTILTAGVFASQDFANWLWENAFSQPWWPMPEGQP